MGFPVKEEPKKSEIIEEKTETVVIVPQSADEASANVEKETPEDKTEPVIQPVNADVDKNLLGKAESIVLKAQNATTLGVRQGAGRSFNSFKPAQHVVQVVDHSKNDLRKYNYLVHCDTCGWEGRYTNKGQAETVAQGHIDKNVKHS